MNPYENEHAVCAREIAQCYEDIRERDAQIEQLKSLLLRAADALEKYTAYPLGMVMSATLRDTGRDLIIELRKAAE